MNDMWLGNNKINSIKCQPVFYYCKICGQPVNYLLGFKFLGKIEEKLNFVKSIGKI